MLHKYEPWSLKLCIKAYQHSTTESFKRLTIIGNTRSSANQHTDRSSQSTILIKGSNYSQ